MGVFVKTRDEDYASLANGVQQRGYAILDTRLTEDGCNRVKSFIDKYPREKAEINYGGTEKRIWGAQLVDPLVQEFGEFSDEVMAQVFHVHPHVKTVLAYSNFPIPPEDQLITGRWHLDSLRPQFKLFCFLTKTQEVTGPLELLPGSHARGFKFWPLITGKYIAPSDLRTGRRRYQSLDDDWVQTQSKRIGGSFPFLCDAGTLVLVDTSAVHRARPCRDGNRYALCTYYDHF